MICSMTAFAKNEVKGTWGTAIWELRSVNQRYLEIHIHLPEQYRGLEPVIRERIRLRIIRGKIECNLRFNIHPDMTGELILNEKLAKQLVEAAKWIKTQSDEGEIDPLAILRWPDVLFTTEPNLDSIRIELLAGLDKALNDFISMRETEGNTLKELIEKRLMSISSEVARIRQQMPAILVWQRERLLNKFKEAKLQLDSNRLEQEIIILAHRIDISEELDRLDYHIKETYQVLKQKGEVGRRLDFIMQEFNRESNTLASKSINTNVTTAAIELKVLIEQIREQAQNIE